MLCLHIETSTPVCSVALSDGDEVLFEKTSFDGPSHAALAGAFVREALDVLGGKALHAVAVSSGPGSYTGLRIGVSLAKGLCFGYGIPLIAVPTLKLLASEAIRQTAGDNILHCPLLAARRMEVYAAIYDNRLNELRPVQADIVSSGSYASFLETRTVCFSGNGAAKCQTDIQSPRVIFLDGIHPRAKNMIPLAGELFADNRFEYIAYYEPFYLKEFQATVPKNKLQ